MNPIDRFARLPLGQFPTPLHRLPSLERALGGGRILIKRDDLSGFALAGNKTRPLEFLLADAVREGCSVVVSGGAPKSNFSPALAAAARVAGLDCELLVSGPVLVDLPIPLKLAVASGAALHFTGGDREELDDRIAEQGEASTSKGRRAYTIPRGGACAVGALGFARSAWELAAQGVPDDATVVLPVGSGASIAGLLAGMAAAGAPWAVVGVSVSRPVDEMRRHVRALAGSCSSLMGTDEPSPAPLVDATVPGMGETTIEQRMSAKLAFEHEGLLFDPSYGVKALHEALTMARSGGSGPIVLWHTGGLPGALQLLDAGGDRS